MVVIFLSLHVYLIAREHSVRVCVRVRMQACPFACVRACVLSWRQPSCLTCRLFFFRGNASVLAFDDLPSGVHLDTDVPVSANHPPPIVRKGLTLKVDGHRLDRTSHKPWLLKMLWRGGPALRRLRAAACVC